MRFKENTLSIYLNDGAGECVYQVQFQANTDTGEVLEAWSSRDDSLSLPHNKLRLVRYSLIYNDISPHTKETVLAMTPEDSDASVLRYIIDHWLIDQPWKPRKS